MPILSALIAINLVSLPLIIIGCGKKENENGNSAGTRDRGKSEQNGNGTVQINFSEVRIEEGAERPARSTRADVYHEAAENLAYPASMRCKNHDDAWRILALYLDCIRAVNPTEFNQFRFLDAALALLHDFSHYIRTGQLSNDVIALAVVYFLVDFHKLKVNLGSDKTPWYKVLCRNAQLEDLERARAFIESELLGFRSEETAVEGF
ncbi:unnamed protein product [Caenorhabditis sp. 36 PRJEB53466]|nr:unnamed protein product [Caenorhabditis sp. 36 PRJEB53466]